MHVSRVIMDKILSELEVVLSVFMIILVIVMTAGHRDYRTGLFAADFEGKKPRSEA